MESWLTKPEYTTAADPAARTANATAPVALTQFQRGLATRLAGVRFGIPRRFCPPNRDWLGPNAVVDTGADTRRKRPSNRSKRN
jgi:hypothetical protein